MTTELDFDLEDQLTELLDDWGSVCTTKSHLKAVFLWI